MRTGAAADGGLNCSVCHFGSAANSDPRGRLRVLARPYKPGVKQTIRVLIDHPEARRWGFQLTARLASNEGQGAGTFTPTGAIRVVCITGNPSPCAVGAGREFATHNGSSNYSGSQQGVMWEIEWSPPAAGAGDVVFYAAGNAANFSGNNFGDSIYTTSTRIEAEDCSLTGTPRITSIRNAASFEERQTGMNALIAIAGSGFQAPGVNKAAGLEDLENNSFPKEMACVAVDIGGQSAPLLFNNPTHINAQVPSITTFGPVPVRILLNPGTAREIRSDPFMMDLSEYSPGFFRLLPTPCIAALNDDGTISGDPSLLPNVTPSRIGQTVHLIATGLGSLDPFYKAGEIVTGSVSVRDRVTVLFNGSALSAIDVLSAGSLPGAVSGVYRISIVVPGGARSGDNQVRIQTADGRISADNTVLFVAR